MARRLKPKLLDFRGKFDPTVELKFIIGTTATSDDLQSAIEFRQRQIQGGSGLTSHYRNELVTLREVFQKKRMVIL